MKNGIIWALALLLCSCGVKKNMSQEQPFIELISYEYGLPLQQTATGFKIRASIKIDHSGNVHQMLKLNNKYIFDACQISKELLDELKSLDADKTGIKQHIQEEKKRKSIQYAGAYRYMKINGKEYCYIPPYMSTQFNLVMDKLQNELNKSVGEKESHPIVEFSTNRFKEKVLPIHEVSDLPEISLPPPPRSDN